MLGKPRMGLQKLTIRLKFLYLGPTLMIDSLDVCTYIYIYIYIFMKLFVIFKVA